MRFVPQQTTLYNASIFRGVLSVSCWVFEQKTDMNRSTIRASPFADLMKKAGAKGRNETPPPKKGDAPAFIQTLTNVVRILTLPMFYIKLPFKPSCFIKLMIKIYDNIFLSLIRETKVSRT